MFIITSGSSASLRKRTASLFQSRRITSIILPIWDEYSSLPSTICSYLEDDHDLGEEKDFIIAFLIRDPYHQNIVLNSNYVNLLGFTFPFVAPQLSDEEGAANQKRNISGQPHGIHREIDWIVQQILFLGFYLSPRPLEMRRHLCTS